MHAGAHKRSTATADTGSAGQQSEAAEEVVDPRSIKLPPELSWARERWLVFFAVILILHPIVAGIAIIWKYGLFSDYCMAPKPARDDRLRARR